MTRGFQGAVFLSILALVFLLFLSQFRPFLSLYGDAQQYLGSTRLELWHYQPLWPCLARLVNRGFGLEGVFRLQAALYLLSIALLFVASQRIIRGVGYVLAVFMVLNVRAYFYISNPLTEVLNLFVFSLVLALWTSCLDEPEHPRRALLVVLSGVLMTVGLTRRTNLVFLVLLLGFLLLRLLRGERRLNLLPALAVVPALLLTASFNVGLQNRENNTGMNLLQFIYLACEPSLCSQAVFNSPHAPTVRAHVGQHGRFAGVVAAFESKGLTLWSPEFSSEMKTVYMRLLLLNPHRAVVAVGKNYLSQVAATTHHVYPEDPNRAVLDKKAVALPAGVTTSLAMLIAVLAPLLIVFSSGRAVFARTPDFPLILLSSWLVSEVVTSQLAFGNSWTPHASRMRFHYEVPGLLLTALMIRAAVHWARRRTETTLSGETPRLPGR